MREGKLLLIEIVAKHAHDVPGAIIDHEDNVGIAIGFQIDDRGGSGMFQQRRIADGKIHRRLQSIPALRAAKVHQHRDRPGVLIIALVHHEHFGELGIVVEITDDDLRRVHAHRELLGQAGTGYAALPGVQLIWRQDCYALPSEREAFGFRDGISHPAVEGSGIPGSNPQEAPLKAGEFILGHVDETGDLAPVPQPDALGRNGTYVVFRKLYQDVAAFASFVASDSARLIAAVRTIGKVE